MLSAPRFKRLVARLRRTATLDGTEEALWAVDVWGGIDRAVRLERQRSANLARYHALRDVTLHCQLYERMRQVSYLDAATERVESAIESLSRLLRPVPSLDAFERDRNRLGEALRTTLPPSPLEFFVSSVRDAIERCADQSEARNVFVHRLSNEGWSSDEPDDGRIDGFFADELQRRYEQWVSGRRPVESTGALDVDDGPPTDLTNGSAVAPRDAVSLPQAGERGERGRAEEGHPPMRHQSDHVGVSERDVQVAWPAHVEANARWHEQHAREAGRDYADFLEAREVLRLREEQRLRRVAMEQAAEERQRARRAMKESPPRIQRR
jgi:hypothetical protein